MPPDGHATRTPVPKILLNQIELSRRWSLSPRTLEAWRWRGEGPDYIRLKGRILYRLADVETFEAANLVHPGDKVGTERRREARR